MKKTSETVLNRLRTQIKSGQLTTPPSSRQLAMETNLHRHTCVKILSQLESEGLITAQRGTVATIVGIENNPVDNAIDYLLSQGMTSAEVQRELFKAFEKRRTISVKSPNKELIEFELDGFKFSPDGFTISDHPGEEFLLQLSDPRCVREKLENQRGRVIGIISKSESFRSHISGALGESGEIMAVEPKTSRVSSVFAFCNQVVCDYLIASRLKEFAIEYRRDQGGRAINIIPVPYLNTSTASNLKRKLIDV